MHKWHRENQYVGLNLGQTMPIIVGSLPFLLYAYILIAVLFVFLELHEQVIYRSCQLLYQGAIEMTERMVTTFPIRIVIV